MLADIQNMISPIKNGSGAMNLFINLTGQVKDVNDIKFNKNIFAKGKIKLISDTISLKDLPIPISKVNGDVNFENLDKGLKEMYRVLKKGGALCIIELTTPVCFPMKQLFKIYSHTILPMYGRIISKDKDAYRYLTASIEAFPQGETMVGIIKSAGFNAASFKRMTFGICTIYIATK